MAEGWIKLHRKLLDNPLWTCESFTRGQAWVDLILLANHEYGFFYKRGIKVEVERGQVGVSEVGLSERWKWSRTKVKKFINDLEKEQQIIRKQNTISQILTVINYDEYQQKEQQTLQQKSSKSAAKVQQKSINKNDKEEKNEKNEKNNKKEEGVPPMHPDFLKFNLWLKEKCPRVIQLKTQIAEKDFITLKNSYTTEQITKVLLDMENYKKLTTNYVSAYLTLTKWLKKEYDGNITMQNPTGRTTTGRNDATERRAGVANLKELAASVLLGFTTEEPNGRF